MAVLRWVLLALTFVQAAWLVFSRVKPKPASQRSRRRTQRTDDDWDYRGVYDVDFDSEPRRPSRRRKKQRRAMRKTVWATTALCAAGTLLVFLYTGLAGTKKNAANSTPPATQQGILLTAREIALPSEISTPVVQTYQTRYDYDAHGNLKTRQDANGSTTTYDYDALNRLVSVNYTDQTQTTFQYNRAGQRTQMQDALGTTTYEYDAYGRVSRVTDPNRFTFQYTYEPRGYLASLICPDGRTINYEWDTNGQLVVLDDTAVGPIHYGYDPAGNLVERTLPNGVKTTYQYDRANRLSVIRHSAPNGSVLLELAYEFDAMGNRTQVTRTTANNAPLVTHYTYDSLYRLVQVTYPDGEIVTYEYDPSGNRTAMASSRTGKTTYTYDPVGRLVQLEDAHGATTFTYDPNGNLLQRQNSEGKITYTWDHENRLIGVSNSSHTVHFSYDGAGRRLSKEVDGQKTVYLQHGQLFPQVLAEQTGGQTTQLLLGLPHSGQITGTAVQFYLEDGLGSIVAVTDAAGQLAGTLDYDAFGAERSPSTLSISAGFTGEHLDRETRLIYLRARYYDPELGRFISADSQPFSAWSTQAINPYTYVRNNPINYTDPSGLQEDTPGSTIGPLLLPEMPQPYPPRRYEDALWSMLGILPRPSGEIEIMTSRPKPDLWNSMMAVSTIETEKISPVIGGTAGLPLPGNILDVAQALRLASLLEANDTVDTTNQNLFKVLADLYPNLDLNPYWLVGTDDQTVLAGMTGKELANLLVHNLTSPALPAVYEPTPSSYGGISFKQSAGAWNQLTDLVGATYDASSGQLVLIGSHDSTAPALSVDDFVVALRTVYFDEQPGVSIESCTPGVQDNCLKVHYDGRFADPSAATETWLTYNADGQLIRTDPPVSKNTHFGWAIFEADRYLKAASLGKDNQTETPFVPGVPGFTNELDLMARQSAIDPNYTVATDNQCPVQSEADRNKSSACHRMWFVPQAITLEQSENNSAVIFEPVKILTQARFVRFELSGQMIDVPGDDPAVQAFVNFFNAHYDEFAREKPELAELKQFAKLLGLARWLKQYNIPVDLDWVGSYKVGEVSTPLKIPAIWVRAQSNAEQQVMIYGGVDLGTPNTYVPGGPGVQALADQALTTRPSLADTTWPFEYQGTPYQAVAFNTAPAPIVGGYQLTQRDIELPELGILSPTFTRNYNSLNTQHSGPYGKGWTMKTSSLKYRQVQSSDNPDRYQPSFIFEDGSQQLELVYQGDGSFRTNGLQDKNMVLGVTTQDDPFTPRPLTDNYQLIPGGGGQPIRMIDTAGNPISFGGFALQQGDIVSAYNTFGQLTGRRSAQGESLTIIYDTDQRPETIQYQSALPGSKTLAIRFSYNPDSGLLEKVETSEGTVFYYTYQGDLLTQIADKNNQPVLRYEYNSADQLTRITNHSGQVLIDNTYDALGRIQRIRRGMGLDAQYYGSLGAVYTNAAGQSSKRLYDTEYRLTQETDQWGHTIEFAYDPGENTLMKVTDWAGHETSFIYRGGRLTQVTAPDGTQDRFLVQDQSGWPQALVNPMDQLALVNYDSRGYVVEITTGLHLTKADAAGNILYENAAPLMKLAYTYDDQHRLSAIQLPNGKKVEYKRDAAGHVSEIIQADGTKVTLHRDSWGRLQSLEYANGYTVEFTRDETGQITAIRLPSGTISYQVDQGLLTQFTDANNHTTRFVYAQDRAQITVIDAQNKQVNYQADPQKGTMTIPISSSGYLEYTYQNNRLTQVSLVAIPEDAYQNVRWLVDQSPLSTVGIELSVETKDMR